MKIDSNYENFYARITTTRVYPTEFVVRAFLANYPHLNFAKLSPGDAVLDMAFGDGRNTLFLRELGFNVSGVEITEGIVQQTAARLRALGHEADLRVGRNSSIPFHDSTFKCVLASHCIYYCDEGEVLRDNLREYSRVLQPGGWLVASVACKRSYIFKEAEPQPDGSFIIRRDPYGNRDGYRLFAFDSKEELRTYFSEYFTDFSFGFADNDYFGIGERVFWVVCRKP
jgi:ubiquinone/menaquinone biosynthesis C-methylase UbiE